MTPPEIEGKLARSAESASSRLKTYLGTLPFAELECLAQVSPQDALTVLTRMGPGAEPRLRHLRAQSPRNPNGLTAQRVLQVARREFGVRAWLTEPCYRALHAAHHGSTTLAQVLSDWPASIVRLSLVIDATRAGGPPLRLLLDSGLLPDCWQGHEATLRTMLEEWEQEAPPDKAHPEDADRSESVPQSNVDSPDVAESDERPVASQEEVAMIATPLASLDAALTEARAHVSRVLDALTADEVPDEASITLLSERLLSLDRLLASEIQRLGSELSARGLQRPPATTVSSLRDGWRFLQTVDSSAIREVERCVHAEGPGDHAEALRKLAAGLLQRLPWNDEDTRLARFCNLLCKLADAPESDVDELLRRDQEARAAAPADLLPAVVLLGRGSLTLPTSLPKHDEGNASEGVGEIPLPTRGEAEEDNISMPAQPQNGPPPATASSALPTADAELRSAQSSIEASIVTGDVSAPVPAVLDLPQSGDVCEPAPPVQPESSEPQYVQPDVDTAEVASDTAVSEPADGAGERANQLIAAALNNGRPSLAYWAATSSSATVGMAAALRAATLVDAIRQPVDECATGLAALVAEREAHELLGSGDLRLLALSTCIRSGIVAPYSGLASATPVFVSECNDSAATCAIAHAVAEASTQGYLLPGGMTEGALGEVTAQHGALEALSREARDFLERERRHTFAPARQLWTEWMRRDGAIGRILHPVSDNQLDLAPSVRQWLLETEFERALRHSDRERRRAGGTSIDGGTRRRLLADAQTAAAIAGRWAQAAERLRTAQRSGPETAALARLQQEVHRNRDAALSELREAAGRGTDVATAAAAFALRSLEATVELIDGHPLGPAPATSSLALAEGLLYSAVPLHPRSLEPRRQPTLSELEEALPRTLEQAFEARLALDDHVGTQALVDLSQLTEDDSLARTLSNRREEALRQVRRRLDEQRRRLQAAVNRARRLGLIDERQQLDFSQRLVATTPSRADLDQLSNELDALDEELNSLGAEAQSTMRHRMDRLGDQVSVYPDLRERLENLLRRGEVGTVDVLLERVQAREALPTPSSSASFRDVLPVLEQLTGGITDDVLAACQRRGQFGPLDFSALSEEAATRSAEALQAWRTAFRDRSVLAMKPALELAGINFGQSTQTSRPSERQSVTRAWFQLADYRPNRPGLPAFGSLVGDRLRALMVLEKRPTPENIADWVQQDATNEPILVLYGGTMPYEDRRAFAKLCGSEVLKHRAVAIIDDAVIAYAAQANTSRLETIMRAALPFTTVNPYVTVGASTGNLPAEMFYGREREIREILDPHGTCLLFGGRQLGKSAVLKAAERRIGTEDGQLAIYVAHCPSEPDGFWRDVASELRKRGIGSSGRVSFATLKTDVEGWLEQDDRRRLFLLLDESDKFFEQDAPDFKVTNQIKTLMDSTQRRFKPVFAGLQSVQRFASLPNQPFAHLGRQESIGPLQPQAAYDLVATPLSILGVEFDSEDLVNRILAFTNYQPALLQLFAKTLLDRIHDDRGVAWPFIVDTALLDTVEEEGSVLEGTRERFGWTLDLDARYRVVAYVAALAVHTEGPDATLSLNELRAQCESVWPAAFKSLRTDAFRAILEEMVGLGVLLPGRAQSSYRLKSVNVLRLLGSPDDIEIELVRLSEKEPPQGFIGDEVREVIEGSRSPLSAAQLADLLRKRNQIRVVVGSEATLVDRVELALRDQAMRVNCVWEPTNNRHNYYRQALRDGRSGDDHRIVFSDLRGTRSEADSVYEAQSILPATAVSRGVVLLVGPDNAAWLRALGAEENPETESLLVPLHRFDELALRAWAVEASAFNDTALRDDLLRVSGGWPCLIDRVEASLARSAKHPDAVAELRAYVDSDEGCRALVDGLGIFEDPQVAAVMDDIVSVGEKGATPEDFAAFLAASHASGAEIFALLRLFDVLDRLPDDTMRVEPVLARAWAATRSMQGGEYGAS